MIFLDSGLGCLDTHPRRVSSDTRQTAGKWGKWLGNSIRIVLKLFYIPEPIYKARVGNFPAALGSRRASLQGWNMNLSFFISFLLFCVAKRKFLTVLKSHRRCRSTAKHTFSLHWHGEVSAELWSGICPIFCRVCWVIKGLIYETVMRVITRLATGSRCAGVTRVRAIHKSL